MLKSLVQIKEEFALIATDHRQLNNFYYGSFLDAMTREDDEGRRLYKYLVVTPNGSTPFKKYTELSFIVTVCDKVKKNYSDEDEVHSDCSRILNDIFITLGEERWNDFSDISSFSSGQLFRDKSKDAVAGVTANITLQVYSEDNSCAIPYINGTPLIT